MEDGPAGWGVVREALANAVRCRGEPQDSRVRAAQAAGAWLVQGMDSEECTVARVGPVTGSERHGRVGPQSCRACRRPS